jgi:hypothetical protein
VRLVELGLVCRVEENEEVEVACSLVKIGEHNLWTGNKKAKGGNATMGQRATIQRKVGRAVPSPTWPTSGAMAPDCTMSSFVCVMQSASLQSTNQPHQFLMSFSKGHTR